MNGTFKLDKMFCCPPLQNHVGAAGNRGLSVLVRRTCEGIRFLLQSRGIAVEDVDKLRPVPGSPDLKINIAYDAGLQFCPWCGRRLQELVEIAPEAYDDLAKTHKPLLSIDL
jgi:hypothetical protein